MAEKTRRLPKRIEEKLKNNFSVPIPEGSILLSALRAQILEELSSVEKETSKGKRASTIIHILIRQQLSSATTKNPESIKNHETIRYLDNWSIEALLSTHDGIMLSLSESQLQVLQLALRHLTERRS